MKPHLAFSVENKLSEDPNAGQLKVDLHFKSLDDFEPENVAQAGEAAEGTAGSAHEAFRSARQPAGQRQAGRALLEARVSNTEKLEKLKTRTGRNGRLTQ